MTALPGSGDYCTVYIEPDVDHMLSATSAHTGVEATCPAAPDG